MKRIAFLLAVLFSHLFTWAQETMDLSSGQWRGELERTDGNNIVFNFEVTKKAGKPVIYLRNANERLFVDDIQRTGDSVFIILPFFDSQFRSMLVNSNHIEGVWVKRLADRNLVMPFSAEFTGKDSYRFKPLNEKPATTLTGRWTTVFTYPETGRTMDAVAVFNQDGYRVTGSFLTPSGDYRYLEGVVDGDSIKLSGFDGGYAMFFTAKIDDPEHISGGKHFLGVGPLPRTWVAQKNAGAKLSEALSSTQIKPGALPKFDFTFKDVNGIPVSINDERFKNKVIILQLLGSWCPNCLDETLFMNEIYERYKSKGVEILGLAYERTPDFERSRQSVQNFMKRLKVQYPVLIPEVAVTDPQRTEKTLPQLENIPAFPTTIFIDKKGEIQKIHAGFSGPGTGVDYEHQKKEYYDIVNALLGL
ncbi:MAG TPA: TlpA disulfide reductase family protein [Agriterribacter sp.]|nr:TlpA disulfide reductase family protein [Agriterribacter sp.]